MSKKTGWEKFALGFSTLIPAHFDYRSPMKKEKDSFELCHFFIGRVSLLGWLALKRKFLWILSDILVCKNTTVVQMLTTLHRQKTCLGDPRVWFETKIKLVPRWLIITFSLMPGKYTASLARSLWQDRNHCPGSLMKHCRVFLVFSTSQKVLGDMNLFCWS